MRLSFAEKTALLALALAALLTIGLHTLTHWPWLVNYLIAISLATFLVYGYDKSAARRGAWRVPERVLHLMALLGGAPGALAGQHFLHHKRVKVSFQRVFWLICGLQIAALAFYLWRRSR